MPWYLTAAAPALLLYFAFWGWVTVARRWVPPHFAILTGFGACWLAHTLTFAAAVSWGLPFLPWLGVPFAILGLREVRRYPLLWGAGALLVLITGWVPVADTDSVGYVLPMAHNAIENQTIGIWDTFNLRSLCRFWGNAAWIGNQLLLNGGATQFLYGSSILAWLVLGHAAYLLGRHFGGRPTATWAAAAIILSPWLVTSLFTLKDDVAFATFGLGLTYVLFQGVRSPRARFALHALLGYGLITSKLFFPVFLFPFLALTVWKQRRHAVLTLGALGLAFLLVTALNGSRIRYNLAIAGSSPKLVAGALCGAAPSELGWAPFKEAPATDAAAVVGDHFTWLSFPVELLSRSLTEPWRILRAWGQYDGYFDGVFSYNYSDLGLLILLALVPIYLVSRYKALLRGNRALALLQACGFVLVFAAILRNPAYNHYRYLYIPLTLLIVLGAACIRSRSVYAALLVSLIPFYARLGAHPALHSAWDYQWRNSRPAYALSVVTFNPVLNIHNRERKGLLRQGPMLCAPIYPGFSAQFLATDGSQGQLVETAYTPQAIISEVRSARDRGMPYDYIMLSGGWNGIAPFVPGNLGFLGELGYQPVGTLLNGRAVVFAR